MDEGYLAACSASGELHCFGDAGNLVVFLADVSFSSWNVYKRWRGEWHWIPVEEGMNASQLREAILKA